VFYLDLTISRLGFETVPIGTREVSIGTCHVQNGTLRVPIGTLKCLAQSSLLV